MDELYAYSERMVRAAIARLPDGSWSAEDIVEAVDRELTIRATVEVDGDEIRIDFAGTAPQGALVSSSNRSPSASTPRPALRIRRSRSR